MDKNYSIDEILNAVNELQKINRERKVITNKKTSSQSQKDNFEIPKSTLKLIEEAEKSKH